MKKIITSEFVKKNGDVNPLLLKSAILKTNLIKIVDENLCFSVDGLLWKPLESTEQGQLIFRNLFFTLDAQATLSAKTMRKILDDIRVDARFSKTTADSAPLTTPHDWVLFRNAVMNIYSGEVYGRNEFHKKFPCFAFRYEVDIDYQKNVSSDSFPTFHEFLKDTFQDNESAKKRLLEAIAYLLSPVRNFRQAVFLVGVPGSGKSVVLEFIRRCLDPKSVSTLDLKEIGQYNNNGDLYGKQLNLCTDIDSDSSFNISVFKRAVCNENVTFSQKYEVSRSRPFTAKLAMAGNAFPKLKPAEVTPFLDRLFTVYFPQAVPANQRNPNLIAALEEEKNAIVSFSFQVAQDRYFKNQQPTDDAASEAAMHRFRDAMNPQIAFCDDFLDIGSDADFVRKSDINAIFKQFCRREGYDLISTRWLSAYIEQRFCPCYTKKNLSAINLGNVRGYTGLCWNLENIKAIDMDIYLDIKNIDTFCRKD